MRNCAFLPHLKYKIMFGYVPVIMKRSEKKMLDCMKLHSSLSTQLSIFKFFFGEMQV